MPELETPEYYGVILLLGILGILLCVICGRYFCHTRGQQEEEAVEGTEPQTVSLLAHTP